MLIINDLKKTCEVCEGSGFVSGFNETGSLQTNISGKCTQCEGKGYELTEFAKELWKLFKPMIQEMIPEPSRRL